MAEYLIIGADAAGLSAALQIKRKKSRADLKVLAKGRIISYGACGIPYVLSGEIASAESLIHFTPERFREKADIPVETGREAVGLFPESHEVEVKNLDTGEVGRETYGRLLIATGAVPRRLPSLDYSQEGVFTLHTVEDLRPALAFIQDKKPRRAVVVGAGNVGLEVIEALHRRGLDPTVIDILDSAAANWPQPVRSAVLEKIREKKIDFRPGTAVESMERRGPGFILKASGQDIAADIIFSQAGTRPATDWCRNRLATHPNGALVVDAYGRTSNEEIFAAGDCASVHHRVLGSPAYVPLGSTANKLGRLAGLNMAGGRVEFPGIVGTQIFKFFELSLAKTGLSSEEALRAGFRAKSVSAKAKDKASYYPGAADAEVELVFESEAGRILGASAVCRGNAAQFIDPAAAAVFAGLTVRDLAWFDAAYAPPFAPVWNALVAAAFRAAEF